ncbi:hypothetical protein BDF14DRAFT_1763045 [Spinellus fusiger]|nr:hypothetical protein BDF14DRAFT_1763045 [Spinellus fusiger]
MAGRQMLMHCLERLHLGDDTELLEKADHFHSQCTTHVSSRVFGKGPQIKSVISIHLAYENLGRRTWDSKLAAELSGCKPSVYDSAVVLVRKSLHIVPTVSFESLAVALGCTTMMSQIQELWSTFQQTYLGQLSAAKRISAQEELTQTVWKGATVYVCAKAFGESITKGHLQSMCACSPVELTKSIKTMQEQCKTFIGALKKKSTHTLTKPSEKRKRGEDAENDSTCTSASKKTKVPKEKGSTVSLTTKRLENDLPVRRLERNKPISGIVSMIPRQDYKHTQRYKEYLEWHQGLVARLSSH